MNKMIILLLITVIALPSCGQKKKQVKPVKNTPKTEIASFTDIPLADDDIRSFFDDNINDFALLEDEDITESRVIAQAPADVDFDETDEFAWINETEQKNSKVVYFDFDRYSIREDQKESVNQDIAYVEEELRKAEERGLTPTVVVNGHADHAAGSKAYNLALSKKRADAIAAPFEDKGIHVKTVGRGSEVPAIVKGEKVTGNRDEQALNRRAEVNIIYS